MQSTPVNTTTKANTLSSKTEPCYIKNSNSIEFWQKCYKCIEISISTWAKNSHNLKSQENVTTLWQTTMFKIMFRPERSPKSINGRHCLDLKWGLKWCISVHYNEWTVKCANYKLQWADGNLPFYCQITAFKARNKTWPVERSDKFWRQRMNQSVCWLHQFPLNLLVSDCITGECKRFNKLLYSKLCSGLSAVPSLSLADTAWTWMGTQRCISVHYNEWTVKCANYKLQWADVNLPFYCQITAFKARNKTWPVERSDKFWRQRMNQSVCWLHQFPLNLLVSWYDCITAW